MTLDDDALEALITSALDEVEVPADGPADVLTARDLRWGPAAAGAQAGVIALDDHSKTEAADDASDEEGTGGRDGGPPVLSGRGRRHLPLARGGVVAAIAAVLVAIVGISVSLSGGGGSSKTTSASSGVEHMSTPLQRAPAAGSSERFDALGAPGLPPLDQGLSQRSPAAGTPALSSQQPQASPSDVPAAPPGSKIVQTGSLTLTVARGRIEGTVGSLSATAAGLGGSVTKSQINPDGSGSTADVTLQVPSGSFGQVLQRVEELGQPSAIATSSTDVTSSYVDLGARINALEATRQQFLAILSKADSIGDILAVENEITPLQTQIEQLQGQQQVLDQQTSTATVTVHVTEQAPAAAPTPAPPSGLSRSWHQATHGFTSGIESVLAHLGGLAVFLLCVAVLGLLARAGWRVARRRLV